MNVQPVVWEVLEEIAVEKFYINDSDKPGILIVPKYWLGMKGHGYAIILNYVGVICTTTSKKKSLRKSKTASRAGWRPTLQTLPRNRGGQDIIRREQGDKA